MNRSAEMFETSSKVMTASPAEITTSAKRKQTDPIANFTDKETEQSA